LVVLQPLRCRCVKCVIHHERDVPEEIHYTYVARTSSNSVISSGDLYVAFCHSAKLCAHAARYFRSQHLTNAYGESAQRELLMLSL